MRWMKLALVLAGASSLAWAQQTVEEKVVVLASAETTVGGGQLAAEMPTAAPRTQLNVEWVAAEFGGRVVKGAPYSAQEVTETRQTLADGNRIVQRSTALVYRDSEGRVRRERSLTAAGPWTAESGEEVRVITILDPAAGVTYLLDPKTKTARKLARAGGEIIVNRPQEAAGKVQQAEVVEKRIEIVTAGSPDAAKASGGMQVMILNQQATGQPVKESLGSQLIEGVSAEGTRVTVTIPAGAIGNERPIQTVSETWYSPQLQTIIMSRQEDPRMGETVFRLTNLSLTEPPAALFQIPPDYKVVEGGAVVVHSKEETAVK